MSDIYLIVHEECLDRDIEGKDRKKVAHAQKVKDEIDKIRHNFDNEIFNLPCSEGFDIPKDLPNNNPIILMGAYASNNPLDDGYCIEYVERIFSKNRQETARHDKGIMYKGFLD